jgi:hypothetical protein
MKALAPTHEAPAPEPTLPPRLRRIDDDGRAISLPSEAFCGRGECITRDEWLRRHAATYGTEDAS